MESARVRPPQAEERRAIRAHGYVVQIKRVPEAVLIERENAAAHLRSLTAVIMGDPLPGRSALDRRLRKAS